ncbi:hypothetical protein LZ023_39940 (plasmid) [Pseudomonas silvicola]|nr:hypothetical protein LZ023_39940 [Pseudomonas silvicola]
MYAGGDFAEDDAHPVLTLVMADADVIARQQFVVTKSAPELLDAADPLSLQLVESIRIGRRQRLL